MAFWVYVLQCADGKYYTGHTDNLERRIAEHQTGGYCDFTSRRLPVRLMWSENFSTRIEALEAERRIKPWSRAKKEALIRRDWAAVSYFARPPCERPSTLVYPERPPQAAAEGLGTNGKGMANQKPFVSSEGSPERSRRVETRPRTCGRGAEG